MVPSLLLSLEHNPRVGAKFSFGGGPGMPPCGAGPVEPYTGFLNHLKTDGGFPNVKTFFCFQM